MTVKTSTMRCGCPIFATLIVGVVVALGLVFLALVDDSWLLEHWSGATEDGGVRDTVLKMKSFTSPERRKKMNSSTVKLSSFAQTSTNTSTANIAAGNISTSTTWNKSLTTDTEVNSSTIAIGADNVTRYHYWGPEGIDLDKVTSYINMTYNNASRFSWRVFRLYQAFPGFIVYDSRPTSNFSKPTLWFPNQVLANTVRGGAEGFLTDVISHWQRALQEQLLANQHMFPSLVATLQAQQRGPNVIPVIFDLGDYSNCADPDTIVPDIKNTPEPLKGVPIFSWSRASTCPYGFPIPTSWDMGYAEHLMGDNNKTKEGWIQKMDEWNRTFPWEDKLNKAHWVGSCREKRNKMLRTVSASNNTSLFEAVRCNQRGRKHRTAPEPRETSMKYKVVLDIDGNSWSERFTRLLCYNTAIVKVTLAWDFEEYYMRDLIPGVHFIPADENNVTDVVEMVIQDDAYLKYVVRNANEWCSERILIDRLNLDFLSIVNGYVEELNRGDPNWTSKWREVQTEFIGPGVGSFINHVDAQVDSLVLD